MINSKDKMKHFNVIQIPKTGQILHNVANGSPPLQHLRR